MVLDRYRSGAGKAFLPIALALGRMGCTPDGISVTSLLFALAAGAAFFFATPAAPWLLLAAGVAVALNAVLDALDGVLARALGITSKRGDYLDHVIDRYADAIILAGVALSVFADVRLGILAIVGTFMTSYMGTQAQALGLGRNYGGLLGRADRLVLLIGAPFAEYALFVTSTPVPLFGSAFNVLLAYFAVLGNVTALQRFAAGWRELSGAGR